MYARIEFAWPIALLVPLAICTSGAAVFAQTPGPRVWVVSDSPGPADFGAIQPAVDAAAEGDVILVREPAGTYAGFIVDSKSLSFVFEPGGSSSEHSPPHMMGGAFIRNLATHQQVSITGLVAHMPGPALDGPLRIEDCAGAVLVQASRFTREAYPGIHPPTPATVFLLRSDAAFLVSTQATGQTARHMGRSGPGLLMRGSRAFVFDSVIEGGGGSSASFGPTTVNSATGGGPGFFALDAQAYVATTTIAGGAGGLGVVDAVMSCHPSQDGGHGAALWGATARITAVDTRFAGGEGGATPVGGLCDAGVGGVDLAVRGGAHSSTFTGRSRRLVVSSPVREGENVVVKFEGRPGERVHLLRGDLKTDAPTDWAAPLLLNSTDSRFMGVIPSAGVLERSFIFHELGQGVDAREIMLQAAFISFPTGGGVTAGNPVSLLVLDRRF